MTTCCTSPIVCHTFTQYTPTKCCISATFCTKTSTSSLLLHVSNNSCCFSFQLLHHKLHTSNKASCHSYNPELAPQGQHIRQQRYSTPFIQNLNPSAQTFVPAAETQHNSVSNTWEPRVPKPADSK